MTTVLSYRQCRSLVSIFLLACVIVLQSPVSAASPTVVSYDGAGLNRNASLLTDALGNFYLTGSINGGFGVLKYDAQGVFLWSYRYASATGASTSIAVDGVGDVFVAGYAINSAGAAEWLTVKLAPGGTQLWSHTIDAGTGGSGQAQKIVSDGRGGLYVGGSIRGASTAPLTVVKYSGDGALLWQRALATGVNDGFAGLTCDSAGNAIAIGTVVNMTNATTDMVTVKLDPQGAIRWRVAAGQATRVQFPRDIVVDASDNIWITGVAASTESDALVPPFTVQYDPSGTLLRSFADGGTAIALGSQGDVLIADTREAATLMDRRPSAAKFDSQGRKLWETVLTVTESGNSARGSRIAVDNAGNIYVGSSIYTNAANLSDYLVSKLDGDGVLQWQHRFNGRAGMTDAVVDAQLDHFGNAFVSGNSYISCPDALSGSCESINTLIFPQGITPNATSSLPLPPPSPPAAPANLTAAVSGSTVTLQWRDNAGNESGFRVERCVGNRCANFTSVAELTANTTTFSNTGLAFNTAFTYRVRAFNAAGNSAYTNNVSVKTPKR